MNFSEILIKCKEFNGNISELAKLIGKSESTAKKYSRTFNNLDYIILDYLVFIERKYEIKFLFKELEDIAKSNNIENYLYEFCKVKLKNSNLESLNDFKKIKKNKYLSKNIKLDNNDNNVNNIKILIKQDNKKIILSKDLENKLVKFYLDNIN